MRNPKQNGMINPNDVDPFQAPLDEEERMLMDPDTWDWESAQEAIVEPTGQSITEVRLSYDELSRIERAATEKGLTVNAYLRYAALHCASQHAPT